MSKQKQYDSAAPHDLCTTLEWFGHIIERPIDIENRIMPIAPSGRKISEEAPDYICPSPTLQPHQRIELYNQQYWWRLLSILHDTCPFALRLFGYTEFNEVIGFPYLMAYRPDSWSLSWLAYHLPEWVEKHYDAPDKSLVLDATRLDNAFHESFLAPNVPAVSLKNIDGAKALDLILDTKLFLQPHLYLFEMERNLCKFRDEFLKQEDGDYWITRDFPTMEADRVYSFVIFRTPFNEVQWKEISGPELQLLSFFKDGRSINEAIEWLETQEEALVEIAAANLKNWFREWVARGWFAHAHAVRQR